MTLGCHWGALEIPLGCHWDAMATAFFYSYECDYEEIRIDLTTNAMWLPLRCKFHRCRGGHSPILNTNANTN